MEVLEQAFKDQDVPPPPPPPIEEDESSDSKISDLSDKIRILEEKLSEVQNQLGGFTKSDDIVSLDEVKGLISESATTAGHPDSDEGKDDATLSNSPNESQEDDSQKVNSENNQSVDSDNEIITIDNISHPLNEWVNIYQSSSVFKQIKLLKNPILRKHLKP